MATYRSILLTSSLLASVLAASPALAQSTVGSSPATDRYPGDEPTDRLAGSNASPSDTIIVTAQKRAQSLIDVPQSVSVVPGGTLERQQATNFQDYLKLIPGLQLTQSNPGEARLTIRGINTGGVAATVATYVDETPFGSSSGQVNAAILAGEFDTFDIARIEVLRGPQGTLYGANSLGGVLKFVTALPQTDKLEARARVSAETVKSGKASYMGSAMINVPLSDTLAVRASGFYRKYGGFIDSIGTGGSDVQKNINDTKSYGGRVSALYTPSTDFSLRLTAILQNLDTNAPNVVETDPVTLKARYGGLTQSQFVPSFTDIAYRLYNGTFTVNLGFADLTSSTSYSTLKESLEDDPTVQYGLLLGTYDPVTGALVDIGLRQHTNEKRFTQEVRLSSHANDRFEWLVGGYYDHEKGAVLQRLDALTAGTLTQSPLLPQLADIFTTLQVRGIRRLRQRDAAPRPQVRYHRRRPLQPQRPDIVAGRHRPARAVDPDGQVVRARVHLVGRAQVQVQQDWCDLHARRQGLPAGWSEHRPARRADELPGDLPIGLADQLRGRDQGRDRRPCAVDRHFRVPHRLEPHPAVRALRQLRRQRQRRQGEERRR